MRERERQRKKAREKERKKEKTIYIYIYIYIYLCYKKERLLYIHIYILDNLYILYPHIIYEREHRETHQKRGGGQRECETESTQNKRVLKQIREHRAQRQYM